MTRNPTREQLERHAATTGGIVHKAQPLLPDDPTEQRCISCQLWTKRVPGGHGSTWVHKDSQAVAGTGPALPGAAEDARDPKQPDYNPMSALLECLDLHDSGAWPDENAVYNLAEVMEHLHALTLEADLGAK